MYKTSCCVLLLALLTPLPATAQNADVEYDGRPLSSWMRQLQDDDLDLRRKAYYALWQLEEKAAPALELVRADLTHPEPRVREWALMAVGDMGPAASAALTEVASLRLDSFPRVRENALEALGRLAEAEAAAILIEHIRTPPLYDATYTNPMFDEERKPSDEAKPAAMALAQLGDVAVPVLVKAATDPEPWVRLWSMYALNEMRAEDRIAALPTVVEALGDENKSVRYYAIRAIDDYEPDHFGDHAAAAGDGLLKAAQEVGEDRVANEFRTYAVHALSTLGPAALPYLDALLENPDTEVRASVIRVIEDERLDGVEVVSRALSDSEWRIRHLAARTLAGMGKRATAALPALEAALKTEQNRQVKEALYDALGEIGS